MNAIVESFYALYEYGEDEDPQWTPWYIIYIRINLEQDGNKSAQVKFEAAWTYPPQEIGDFINDRLVERRARKPQPNLLEKLDNFEESPRGPVDFGLDRDCYVVVEISENMPNWKFRDVNAITTKADFDINYFDLGTVSDIDDGRICMAYFSARARPTLNPQRDGFNLHIRFDEDNNSMIELIFDPDIPNPGNPPPPKN